MNLTQRSPQKERDSEAGVANSWGNKNPCYYQRRIIYLSLWGVTFMSAGTPPTKNTTSSGSRSNNESVPGASPFWMNFCSSVELWLGIVRKTFPCLPNLDAARDTRQASQTFNSLSQTCRWCIKQKQKVRQASQHYTLVISKMHH